MAQFGKCPECGQLTLLAITRRDALGDLVAFLKCVSCDYEGKTRIASSIDLDGPYGFTKHIERAFGPLEDDDD